VDSSPTLGPKESDGLRDKQDRNHTRIVNSIAPIKQWTDVDLDRFHNEIVPLNQPAHIKSLVRDWPSVQAGNTSTVAIADYLKGFDTGEPVLAAVGAPDINGRFFYRDDLLDVNFQRTGVAVTVALEQLLETIEQENPPAIAIQAIPVDKILPGFGKANSMPILDGSVAPTMWFGNRAIVAPHYDIQDNIACVVAGERKFTVFPPDQINNLYIGPTLGAPGGVPISMVDLRDPDMARYPRFAEALEAAQQAVLEPGDAVYIPALWWHAVESLQRFNVLVNYWWGGVTESQVSPNDSLTHAMLGIANLSPEKRAAWKAYFDYYVFRLDGDPTAHLPEGLKDVVTSLTPEQRQAVLKFLSGKLQQ
jgi:hypothetical protein